MRSISTIVFALALTGLTGSGALATPAAPKVDAEYTQLASALPTKAEPGKVEVIEFFSYACPHCRAFDPALTEWVKKNADKVSFRRVHVAFHAAEQPLQRMYVTFEAMGLTEQMHAKVFNAVHEEHQRLLSEETITSWVGKSGVDASKFSATWKSFGIPSRVSAAQASVTGFGVNLWPSIGIDGRFYTSPSKVAEAGGVAQNPEQQYQGALTVMDFLVAKARAEKK